MTVVEPDRAPSTSPQSESEARPTTTTVHASWRGARRYEIGRPGGPAVAIDAAGETGLGPVDTMLGALASCSPQTTRSVSIGSPFIPLHYRADGAPLPMARMAECHIVQKS